MSDQNDNIDSEILSTIEDPAKYREFFLALLESDTTKLSQKVLAKLNNNEIDAELDLNLRRLGEKEPYNMLIPIFRDQLNLSIKNDAECIESLESIRQHVNKEEDKKIIDILIDFIKSTDGELPEDVAPEIDLLMMINDVPVEKFTLIYNCIDYIREHCSEE